MPARSTESSRKPAHTDVHDIQALTSTGRITLPSAASVRTPAKADQDSAQKA